MLAYDVLLLERQLKKNNRTIRKLRLALMDMEKTAMSKKTEIIQLKQKIKSLKFKLQEVKECKRKNKSTQDKSIQTLNRFNEPSNFSIENVNNLTAIEFPKDEQFYEMVTKGDYDKHSFITDYIESCPEEYFHQNIEYKAQIEIYQNEDKKAFQTASTSNTEKHHKFRIKY